MDHHTDEELAGLYQGGNRAAANEIVDRYWRQSELIALEYPISGIDVDDRHMEAIQGLLKAAAGWRPGKGTKFKTFAKLAMRRILIDLYRKRHQKNQLPPDMKLSLDMPLSGDDDAGALEDDVPDPIDVFDEVERRLYAEAAASDALRAHKEVLFGMAQEYDQTEIAAYLGIRYEEVQGAVRFNRAIGAVFAAKNAV